jgi:hypothetical protein
MEPLAGEDAREVDEVRGDAAPASAVAEDEDDRRTHHAEKDIP